MSNNNNIGNINNMSNMSNMSNRAIDYKKIYKLMIDYYTNLPEYYYTYLN